MLLDVGQHSGDFLAIDGAVSIKAEGGELFDELLVGFSESGHCYEKAETLKIRKLKSGCS